jgi:hypothetical protein
MAAFHLMSRSSVSVLINKYSNGKPADNLMHFISREFAIFRVV